MPSLTPSSSGQPSSEPSLAPSAQPSSQPSLTPSESVQPSSIPSFTRTTKIQDLLLLSTVSESDVLNDEASPQGKAFLWITSETNSQLMPGNDDDKIIQRYVLSVLYYALNGANWKAMEGWLTDGDECNWEDISCEDATTSVVTHYEPERNRLEGTIPSEIGELTGLVSLDFRNNNIEGTIPTEFGSLASLETLLFDSNDLLSGSIPNDFGNLINLQKLQLQYTGLSGSMPNEICALRTDAVPAGQLSVLTADCGGATPEVSCSCCTFCHGA